MHHWHLVSSYFSLGCSACMTWCTILYELKSRMLPRPIIKHRNNMLDIGFHIDMIPVSLSEYTWFFYCFIEAALKHPINLYHYSIVIDFFKKIPRGNRRKELLLHFNQS